MRNRNLILRISILFIVGTILTTMTYRFKFTASFFDTIIYTGIVIIGLGCLIWSLIIDWSLYRKQKSKKYLLTSTLGALFLFAILTLSWKINSDFNKPTLLKAYYDGDINGTGIDFKTDGTYIFDNSAIGFSDYEYGKYQMSGNQIILDKNRIENVITSSTLEINEKDIEFNDSIRKEFFVQQIDENGQPLKNQIEFKVTIDNRNE